MQQDELFICVFRASIEGAGFMLKEADFRRGSCAFELLGAAIAVTFRHCLVLMPPIFCTVLYCL